MICSKCKIKETDITSGWCWWCTNATSATVVMENKQNKYTWQWVDRTTTSGVIQITVLEGDLEECKKDLQSKLILAWNNLPSLEYYQMKEKLRLSN